MRISKRKFDVLLARRFGNQLCLGGAMAALLACSSPELPPFPDDPKPFDAGGDGARDVSVDTIAESSYTPMSEGGDAPTERADAPGMTDTSDGGPTDADARNDLDARDAAPPDADAALTCDGGPTILACGGSCVNVATNAQHCRACGHDCGQGSSCQAGVCQPVILYSGTTLPEFQVDGSGIYFNVANGVSTCPLTGCALSPTPIATGGGPLLVANSYFTISSPLVPVGTDYSACPTSGCTANNKIFLISANRQVGVHGLISSPSHFFYSFVGPPGEVLAGCLTPTAGGCTMRATIASVKATPVIANDSYIYFTSPNDAGNDALFSCPATAMNCTPTPMYVSGKSYSAYGSDLYVLFPVTGPMQTINKCPSTGCPSGVTKVVTTDYGMLEIAVDASGIYWTRDSSIQACKLTGCVGGPVDVALNQGMPQTLRLSGGFVYWVNAADNTIRRVAEPVL